MPPYKIDLLLQSTIDTLVMVGVSALFVFFFGLIFALILVTTDRQGIFAAPKVNALLGFVINTTRSIPFLI